MRSAQDELVWITADGKIEPIGDLAASRLRGRQGGFRLLPTPQHVVFMRYTGDDGRRDAEDGAIVRIAGEISGPGTLCDVLALLGQTGWRGELNVQLGEESRSVFVDSGNVVGARTNVEEEHFGRILFRFGVIDEEAYEQVMERVRQGELFGGAAVELGLLTREQVYTYLGKQVEEIVFAIMGIADGMYCFLDGFDDADLVFRHNGSINGLLMDGVTRMDEMRYFSQRIPSSEYIPERQAGREPTDAALRPVWEAIDGQSTVLEIARALNLGDFDTTKQLFQLLQAKVIAMRPPATKGGPVEIVEAANAALKQIHQEADSAGRGTVLRTTLASFSDGVYEMLFHGAGPFDNGAFKAEAVVANAAAVAAGGSVERFLKEILYDYVSFALFTASSMLRRDRGKGLGKLIEPLMSRLRPIG
ncbi:MAG: DUF4388 domain-containing protein [Myxococcales bacterium]|nr:DUF4388 domain-containing protein [Myxococcales bacterium]MCB9704013.1 DUF4388 domain-containing protein [Myxococcales bacterium]